MLELFSGWPALVVNQPSQTVWKAIQDKVAIYIMDEEVWINIFFTVVHIALIILVSQIAIRIVKKSIAKTILNEDAKGNRTDLRRKRTIAKLFRNTVIYAINFIAILFILDQIGIALIPLIAGAGVVGLAIAFGAQSLVKDFVTGFFIIFEDQFAIGDVVEINKIKGTVKEIGIRTTVIQAWTGEVHTIPNGTIQHVTNYSLHNSIGFIDVSVSIHADIDEAILVIKQTANELYEESDLLVSMPKVLGVQSIGNTNILIRVLFECLPNMQFDVTRQLNARLKKALDAHQIKLP